MPINVRLPAKASVFEIAFVGKADCCQSLVNAYQVQLGQRNQAVFIFILQTIDMCLALGHHGVRKITIGEGANQAVELKTKVVETVRIHVAYSLEVKKNLSRRRCLEHLGVESASAVAL